MLKNSIIWILVVFPALLNANKDSTVTIREFIETAINVDPEIKKILNMKHQTEYLLDLNLPSNHILLDNRSQVGLDTKSKEKTHSISTTLSKPFHNTGTKLELNFATTNSNDREEQTTSLKLEQKLINNGFGEDYRLNKSTAEYQKEIIILESREQFESRVEKLFSIYYDYQLSILSTEAMKIQIEDALKLDKFVKKKAIHSIATKIDIIRSEHQVLLKKIELEKFKRESDRLKKITSEFSGINFLPKYKVNKSNSKHLVALVHTNSKQKKDRRLKILQLKEKQATTEVLLAKNTISPELAAFIGIQSDDSTRFNSKSKKTEAIVGLNFSMAIGTDTTKDSKKKKAIYDKSDIGYQYQNYLFDKKEKNILLKGLVDQQISLVRLSEKRLNTSKNIIKIENDRYRKGKIDLDKLISAQDLVNSALLNNLKEQINLRKTIIQWLAATDQLTEKKNVLAPWSLLD